MKEPAAYMCLDTSRLRAGHCADKVLRFNRPKQPHIVDIVPLYPKREWVGLTDEEISEVMEMGYGARASIEIALEKAEEKNT
jgi:hypothetical protein